MDCKCESLVKLCGLTWNKILQSAHLGWPNTMLAWEQHWQPSITHVLFTRPPTKLSGATWSVLVSIAGVRHAFVHDIVQPLGAEILQGQRICDRHRVIDMTTSDRAGLVLSTVVFAFYTLLGKTTESVHCTIAGLA